MIIIIIMIVAFFLSLALHVHARSFLIRLKQNHKAEKRFAILIIVFSFVIIVFGLFLLNWGEAMGERERVEEKSMRKNEIVTTLI